MSDAPRAVAPKRPWHRLWAVALWLLGARALLRAAGGEDPLPHGLLGAGMVLGAWFAWRHDLTALRDRSTAADRVVLLASAALVIAAAAVALAR